MVPLCLFCTSNTGLNEHVVRDLVELVVLVVQHHNVLLMLLQLGICGDLLHLKLLPGCFLLIQLLLQVLDEQHKQLAR